MVKRVPVEGDCFISRSGELKWICLKDSKKQYNFNTGRAVNSHVVTAFEILIPKEYT